MVKAENFHPMRGDVFAGNEIAFPGRVLTIAHSGNGWKLIDCHGAFVAGPFDGAYPLTDWIVRNAYGEA